MNWGTYGVVVLVVFALFIILMLINPKLSCFGRRIKSPLYPLLRKKKLQKKTEDYGFNLVDLPSPLPRSEKKRAVKPQTKKNIKKTDDYGFRLD